MNLKKLSDSIFPIMKIRKIKEKLLKKIKYSKDDYDSIWEKVIIPAEWPNIEADKKKYRFLNKGSSLVKKEESECDRIDKLTIIFDDIYKVLVAYIPKLKREVFDEATECDYTKDHLYDNVKQMLKTFFANAGIDGERLNQENFDDYIFSKSIIKDLQTYFLDYKEKYMENIRKQNFREIDADKLVRFVKVIETILRDNVKDEAKKNSMINALYATTKPYLVVLISKIKKSQEKINQTTIKLLKSIDYYVDDHAVERKMQISKEHVRRQINKMDDRDVEDDYTMLDKVAVYNLLCYLDQMIQPVADHWRDVADIMDNELRKEFRQKYKSLKSKVFEKNIQKMRNAAEKLMGIFDEKDVKDYLSKGKAKLATGQQENAVKMRKIMEKAIEISAKKHSDSIIYENSK